VSLSVDSQKLVNGAPTQSRSKGGEGEEDKKEEEKGLNLFAATGV
jgi:hypothetical protein